MPEKMSSFCAADLPRDLANSRALPPEIVPNSHAPAIHSMSVSISCAGIWRSRLVVSVPMFEFLPVRIRVCRSILALNK